MQRGRRRGDHEPETTGRARRVADISRLEVTGVMADHPVDIVDRGVLVVEVDGDRCDARRCGAAAFVFAKFETGSLAFCGHHGTEYLPGLHRSALRVIDLRHLIPK